MRPSITVLAKVSRDGKNSTVITQLNGVEATTSLVLGSGGALIFGTADGIVAVQTRATGLDGAAPWPSFRHDRHNTGNADYVPKHLYPCNPGEQLYGGLSPNYASGDIAYLETVQVAYKGISLPGGTCNLMYFDAWGSEHRMEFCYNLPFGYEIPVAEGRW